MKTLTAFVAGLWGVATRQANDNKQATSKCVCIPAEHVTLYTAATSADCHWFRMPKQLARIRKATEQSWEFRLWASVHRSDHDRANQNLLNRKRRDRLPWYKLQCHCSWSIFPHLKNMKELHSRLSTGVRLAKTTHANLQNRDLIGWLNVTDGWLVQSPFAKHFTRCSFLDWLICEIIHQSGESVIFHIQQWPNSATLHSFPGPSNQGWSPSDNLLSISPDFIRHFHAV